MGTQKTLPLIPIKEDVVFPNRVQQIELIFFPEDNLRAKIFEENHECIIVLVKAVLPTQKDLSGITINDTYAVGVKAEVLQYEERPDMTIRLLVEGQSRTYIHDIRTEDNTRIAEFTKLEDQLENPSALKTSAHSVHQLLLKHMDVVQNVPSETLLAVLDANRPSELADLIGGYLTLNCHDKQVILEEVDVEKRLVLVKQYLNDQIIESDLDKQLDSLVQDKVERERKEVLLRAKLRAIYRELNETSQEDIVDNYKQRVKALDLSQEADNELMKEIRKLESLTEDSMECGSIRSYLDFVLDLPWGQQKKKQSINIQKVHHELTNKHYGLDDVKNRILEYLAVKKLSKKTTSNILCLVGPPGVGKTTIIKSVANALNRPFYRMALGGIRDEADLRGHRRSYVGALPGRIVMALDKTKALSSIILLDEVDKMGSGFKGDPASILLEILDPEQNTHFVDHYLQIPVDLSKILFMCTANDINEIPPPLANRLEIIQIPGYGIAEKIEIAKNYLIPTQIKNHGLSKIGLKMDRAVIKSMIVDYTTDVGLRELNRVTQRILRKIALRKVRNESIETKITKPILKDILGPGIPKPSFSLEPRIGRSVALYSIGMIGNILPIEAVVFPGTGNHIATGNIDPLLEENISTSVSFLKKYYKDFGLQKDFLKNKDIHIHFQKQEFVKKGEGWGLAIFAAILSALMEVPLPATVAFSGQISLLGKVLPTQELEQKLLAASQLGITTVILSAWNMKEEEITIPPQIKLVDIHTLAEMKELITTTLWENISGPKPIETHDVKPA